MIGSGFTNSLRVNKLHPRERGRSVGSRYLAAHLLLAVSGGTDLPTDLTREHCVVLALSHRAFTSAELNFFRLLFLLSLHLLFLPQHRLRSYSISSLLELSLISNSNLKHTSQLHPISLKMKYIILVSAALAGLSVAQDLSLLKGIPPCGVSNSDLNR